MTEYIGFKCYSLTNFKRTTPLYPIFRNFKELGYTRYGIIRLYPVFNDTVLPIKMEITLTITSLDLELNFQRRSYEGVHVVRVVGNALQRLKIAVRVAAVGLVLRERFRFDVGDVRLQRVRTVRVFPVSIGGRLELLSQKLDHVQTVLAGS